MGVLAIKKNAYKLSIAGNKEVTVMLENAPDWANLIKSKAVIKVDGDTINCAYLALVSEVHLGDSKSDTALAYARSLTGGLRAVALERLRKFEAAGNGKMPVRKIVVWMQYFIEMGKSEDLKEFYDIYLEAGGDESQIGFK